MHVLSLSEPVNLGKTLGVLGAGQWLMHDLNAFEIALKAKRGAAKVNQYYDGGPDDRNTFRSSLIMRSGAIGDLLLLTPVLAEMKRKSGLANSLCCFAHHQELFAGNEDVLSTIPYPLALDASGKFIITSLENTMECDHTQHATDVFAKALGLTTPLADYRPVYHVTDAEKEATQKHLFKQRPTLAVQVKASVANRDYPLPLWYEVITKLEQRGWGIVLLGRKGQTPPMPDHAFIRDLSALGLSFRESAAVLSQCQAFVGVDSAWAHMCHALDIPAVVLFAAFDWKNRTGKAPKTIAISGVGECAPCSWHMHAGHQFPPGKPCSKPQVCTVLASITPERIVAKVSLLKP